MLTLPVRFRGLVHRSTVKFIWIRKRKAIPVNQNCRYDNGVTDRPMVQVNAMEVTIELVGIGHIHARN